MLKTLAGTLAVAGLLAVPAMAAGTTGNNSGNAQGSSADATQIEQNIRQDLSKAGYTDIQVMPGSFLVHAKDSKGNPTEMMVSPHSVTAVTAMNPSGNGSGNSSQGTNNQSTTKQ
jgi:hypothetical protein